MTCHQGRESKATVDARLVGKPLDTIDATITHSNVHYAATGGIVYGDAAQVAYQYTGTRTRRRSPTRSRP